jgi:hypothetical protein
MTGALSKEASARRPVTTGEDAMDLLRLGCALFAMVGVTFSNYSARAEVTRIEVTARADILGGKSFGTVGAYEKIIGKVYFSIDHASPQRRHRRCRESPP